MLGRAKKLERLGLAEPIGPASWTLKAGLEQSLRDLSIPWRTSPRDAPALTGAGREPDVTGLLCMETPAPPGTGSPGRARAARRAQRLRLRIVEGVGRPDTYVSSRIWR